MPRDGIREERLRSFIRSNHGLAVNELNQRLIDELSAYKAGDFKDDISLFSIHVNSA